MSNAKMNKQDYYETMVRNRIFLWSAGSSMCTLDNLTGVMAGWQYAPLYREVRLEPCPKPPLKKFIIQAIQRELAKKEAERLKEQANAQATKIGPQGFRNPLSEADRDLAAI